MLSAVVIAPSGANSLAVIRTMAALVPAAVHGLVRDVTLACTLDPMFVDIADHAGCNLATDASLGRALEKAMAGTREAWVLLLRAGFAPEAGFLDEMGDFVAGGLPRAGVLRAAPGGWLTRLFPQMSEVAGLLAPKAMLQGRIQDFVHLQAKLKPRLTLHVTARRVV